MISKKLGSPAPQHVVACFEAESIGGLGRWGPIHTRLSRELPPWILILESRHSDTTLALSSGSGTPTHLTGHTVPWKACFIAAWPHTASGCGLGQGVAESKKAHNSTSTPCPTSRSRRWRSKHHPGQGDRRPRLVVVRRTNPQTRTAHSRHRHEL